MKRILFVFLTVCLAAGFLSADFYIKQNIHTDAFSMMGQSQPAKDEINNMWYGDKKWAMHGDEQSIIIDMNKNIMHMVNHPNKTVVEMQLPLDITKYLPEQFSQMMGNITVTVTPTGQTEKVGQWNCDIYNVVMNMMMIKMNMKVWATKDVPFDWKTFSDEMFANMAKATMRLGDESVKEFMKIEGFQIKTEVSMDMMGSQMKSRQEVVEITKMDPPEGTYDPPADYEKTDKFSMQDLMRR